MKSDSLTCGISRKLVVLGRWQLILKRFCEGDSSETLGDGFSRLRETTIKIWGFMCIYLGKRNFCSV